MKKSKKRDNKIVIGVIIMSLLVIITIGFSLFLSFKTTEVHKEISVISEIVVQTQSFGIENFHTQLEMWEYVYDPNQERLDAFEQHNLEQINLINKLIESAEAGKGYLSEDALNEIYKIKEDLEIIQTDWESILEPISEFRILKEQGASKEILDQLNSQIYDEVVENEDLFDNLEFNQRIDNFIEFHGQELREIREEIGDLHTKIEFSLIILAGQYLILLILIAIWLGILINKK